MEAIITAFLTELVGDYLQSYIIGKIRNLLDFEAAVSVYARYNDYRKGLLRTSEKVVNHNNHFGEHQINKLWEYEHKIEQEILSVRDDGLTVAEVRISIPMFSSYVKWETPENLDSLNLRRFRAYPELYKIGSFHLQYTWPELNIRSPHLSDAVFFDRASLLKKINAGIAQDIGSGIFTFSHYNSFNNATIKGLISDLWKGTEKYWWQTEIPGKITTYGWPTTISVKGHLNVPSDPPSLPEGSLG